MSEWQDIKTIPEGRVVMTKIKDSTGEYNQQALKKAQSGLFFVPDGSMYFHLSAYALARTHAP